MQPPKRQIIKTRSQRPYMVARVIIVLIVLSALVIAAAVYLRSHGGHAAALPPVQLALQEAHTSGRRAQTHLHMGFVRV